MTATMNVRVNRMKRLIRVSMISLLALELTGPASMAGGLSISDKDLNITLALPNGFKPIPDFRSPPGVDIRYAFARMGRDGQPDACLFIERLGGVIGREPLSEAQVKKLGDARLCHEKWKSFDVDVFVVRETAAGRAYLTRNVQVPIKPRAIQLKIFGPESQDAELASLTRALLTSLDGPSNWLTDADRYEQLGEGVGKFLVWIVGIGAFVFWLAARQDEKFQQRTREMGLPPELAAQKIRPSWAWHLLGAYVIFGGIVAASAFSLWAIRNPLETPSAMQKSLGVFALCLLAGLAIIIVTARRRAAARRRILALCGREPSATEAAMPPAHDDLSRH